MFTDKPCVVRRTMLGVEDHGILTCMLHVDGDGWGIGFGGYALDQPMWTDPQNKRDFLGRQGTNYGMEFIRRVLDTLEVETWEKLPGTVVRIRFDGDGLCGERCVGIGHAYKNRWFIPTVDLNHFIPEKER